MVKVNMKPLSVNRAWQGKRYKTNEYKAYETEMLLLLPGMKLPDPPYFVYYTFGVSSPLADWDNPVKPFQDVLQKRYGFDDNNIWGATVRKVRTPKGQEFVSFRIEHWDEKTGASLDEPVKQQSK